MSGRGLALAGALLAASCSGGETRDRPPNVLLVSIDSLRADHLGCYGYERDTSPVLDALAAEGARFTRASAPTSWTLPSHVTLFTALPPAAHGVLFDPKALDERALTLAEVFRGHGYATAGVVGGPFLRSLYGLAQGFELYDDETVVRPLLESHRGQTSPELVRVAGEWLDEWAAGSRARPFFLFVHLWDVHYDYTPPPPYDRMFGPEYTGDISAENFELGDHIHPDMDPRDLERIVALYDGEIRYTDEWVGRLLAKLDDHALADETVVVVTSDHGEEFFEHGSKGHRKNLYETTLEIPLIVRYPPRIAPGLVLDTLAGLDDVGPTLLGLAGLEVPEEFGLADAPEGYGGRDLFADPGAAGEARFGDLHGDLTSVRTERLKLIRERGREGAPDELFDLERDPGERTPLALDTPAARALEKRLDFWRAYWARRGDLAVDIELDAAQEAALRDLGYIR